MEEREAPEGWVVTQLSKVFEINPRKPGKDELPANAAVAFVPMAAVDERLGAVTVVEERAFGNVRKGYTAFRDEDVILAKITPCMENGKAAVVRGLVNGIGFGSTEFHVLRSVGAALPEYVYHFVRQESFRRAAEAEMTGSVGQKRVPTEYLQTVSLPLPPLAEQHRIVAKLEEALAQANAARERLEKLPAILKRFRQSVLAAACSGRLTEGWPAAVLERRIVRLGILVTDLDQGWSPKCNPEPSPSDDIWGVIKTTAVQAIGFLPDENKRLPAGLSPRPELEIRPGDLLITRAGPRARAGVVCVVEDVRPRLMICDKVYRFRLQERSVHPKYAVLILNAPQLVEEIDAIKTGSSDSGLNLTRQRFLDLEIPLPPLPEQQEIVHRIEALFAWADTVERRVEAARAQVNRLTQAVLAKAFRGELAPTEAELARREGREYEPASVLLERIRQQRGGDERTSRGKRRTRARAATSE